MQMEREVAASRRGQVVAPQRSRVRVRVRSESKSEVSERSWVDVAGKRKGGDERKRGDAEWLE